MLVTRSGPSSAIAISSILRSASATRSSPVSRRRIAATATEVPSASVPVIASSRARNAGGPLTLSISACVTDSKSATWSRAMTSIEGAMIGSAGARSSATSGSLTMSSTRPFICASPSGESASPRKRRVTTLTSPDSPKTSSISTSASATALPLGRVAAVSGGGSRNDPPAAITKVTMMRTISVIHGRAVTSRLTQASVLSIAYPASEKTRDLREVGGVATAAKPISTASSPAFSSRC